MPSPSYVHGTSTTPLLGETIGENLRRTVERHGEREALVVASQGYRATYRQLWDATTQAALGLLALGVEKGDRVSTSPRMKKVQARMNMREVTICYGMTETSSVSTQSALDDPLDKRVSTVGRVHPHGEVKIVDANTGAVVPRGTPGELCTRGYSVMLGYWNNPEATKTSWRSSR
jgi:acyl-CoA synthetase (AMP-forming)/AMP-acid ligase II